ncbi:SH3 domain-containing protein [Thermodesulfobacteriota bacterium]
MRRTRTFMMAFIIVSLAMTSSSLAQLRKAIKVNRVVPPEQVMEGGIGALFIDEIDGDPTGGGAKSLLSSLILEEDRGEKTKSSLLSTKLRTLEQGLVTNPYTVIEDRVSADAIIGGDASASPVTRKKYTEIREEIYYEKNSKGEKVKKKRKVRYYCVEVYASVSMALNSIRTADSVKLGEYSTAYEYDKTFCSDEGYPATKTNAEIIGGLTSNCVHGLVNKFTPHYEIFTIKLKKHKTIKDANKIAKKGDYDFAMAKYLDAYKNDEYNSQAIYNIALLHDLHGNYDQAMTFYQKAENIATDDAYISAMSHLDARKAQVDKLEQMGMELITHDFKAVACNQFCVKGSNKKRYPIYTSPNKKASVVKNVPGGMRLEPIEEEDKWIKVRLKDETEGWMERKSVLMK